MSVFLDKIPLVDHDHHALGLVQDVARDMLVLGGDLVLRVNQQQADIGAVDGLEGAQYAVFFHTGGNFAPSPDAGRIYEDDLLAAKLISYQSRRG